VVLVATGMASEELEHYNEHKAQYDNPDTTQLVAQTVHRNHNDKIIFYRDEFVELAEDQVKIFYYYFPGGTKHIKYENIQSVATDIELGLDFLCYKGWGMGLAPIWWALDASRVFGRHTNVVITCFNDGIQKGFATKDAPKVISIIKERMEHARSKKKD